MKEGQRKYLREGVMKEGSRKYLKRILRELEEANREAKRRERAAKRRWEAYVLRQTMLQDVQSKAAARDRFARDAAGRFARRKDS